MSGQTTKANRIELSNELLEFVVGGATVTTDSSTVNATTDTKIVKTSTDNSVVFTASSVSRNRETLVAVSELSVTP